MRHLVLSKSALLLCLVFLTMLLIDGCVSSARYRADKFATHGEWDKAVASYREAFKKDPFNTDLQQRLDAAKVEAAAMHYAAGQEAFTNHQLPTALAEFKSALGLDPSKPEYHARVTDILRLKEARDQFQAGEKLRNLGRQEDALLAYENAVEMDPSLTEALTGITEITKEQRSIKGSETSSHPITLRFQNVKLKEIFEILARTASLNVIFDKEVRDEPMTIFIKDLPFDDAMNLILNTNNLVAQPVAPGTILILPNNKQKQGQYQDLLMKTFYLSNAKAKDAVNLIRTMLDSKKIYVDEKVNAIVIRDEPVKLQLAERLLFAIDRRDPEVELDVEVLEVNRTKIQRYGVNYAKQAGAGINGVSTAPTTLTFKQLTSLSPESYLFTLPASVLLDFFKQDSDAKTLASPKLRVVNGKSASINIGDKQPILLSTTNVLPGQAATGSVPTTSTVTSIEFKDTGVKLTVEPTINLLNEVTLKLKVEVTRLGDQVTLQAAPEIKQFKFGNRSAETVLTMKDDESVILAGLIQEEDRKTKSSVPWLGDIPILGQLFSSNNEERIETEVVLTITPHVVHALTPPPLNIQTFWSGTENTYSATQLFPTQVTRVSQIASSKRKGDSGESNTQSPRITQSSISDNGIAASPQEKALGSPAALASAPPSSDSATVKSDRSPTATTDVEARSRTETSTLRADSVGVSSTTPELPSVLPGISLRPADIKTTIGKEIRLEILMPQPETWTESSVMVRYDPAKLDFRRVGPGIAAISVRASEGLLTLMLRRQGGDKVDADNVLANLFFEAKVNGDHPVMMEMMGPTGSTLVQPVTSGAVIHAQ